MLSIIPAVILAGIISQIVSLKIVGPTHRFYIWYVALMVVLWLVNVLALILHLRDRTKTGILIAAWCGLICVSTMVFLDTLADTTDGFPWIILTLYIAACAIGEVIGGKTAIIYDIMCGMALLFAGIAQNRMDDALPAIIVLCLVAVWSLRAFERDRQLDEHSQAIEIVTNGKWKYRGSD